MIGRNHSSNILSTRQNGQESKSETYVNSNGLESPSGISGKSLGNFWKPQQERLESSLRTARILVENFRNVYENT